VLRKVCYFGVNGRLRGIKVSTSRISQPGLFNLSLLTDNSWSDGLALYSEVLQR